MGYQDMGRAERFAERDDEPCEFRVFKSFNLELQRSADGFFWDSQGIAVAAKPLLVDDWFRVEAHSILYIHDCHDQ